MMSGEHIIIIHLVHSFMCDSYKQLLIFTNKSSITDTVLAVVGAHHKITFY